MKTEEYLKNKYGDKSPTTIVGMTRRSLYELFAELGFKVGGEIGLFRGRNAKLMFNVIPGLKLYGVEPFADQEYTTTDPKSLEHITNMKEQVSRRLEKENVIIIDKFSEDAVKDVPYDSLDFVYIDGDHSYDYAMLDIILWARRVRKGGIVSGHDYTIMKGRKKRDVDVKQAVDDYVAVHNINPLYLTDNRCARTWGDRCASWFFVKT